MPGHTTTVTTCSTESEAESEASELRRSFERVEPVVRELHRADRFTVADRAAVVGRIGPASEGG